MPNIIGMRTTCTIEINKELGDILTHSLANNKISAGVTNGANMVVTEVTVTESATSPLDKKVMTFDEVPPVQHPTNITPNATSGGKLNPFAKIVEFPR